MSLKKIGSPEKIQVVIVEGKDFKETKEDTKETPTTDVSEK